ncbi:hypothetical protein J4419_05870 [Candidatus Woesearchaeota archaeon]|nr:hypothetical protein [Candidatus Woesearchaeota archaeon]
MGKQEYIGSYIEHFDEALGGGIPSGHIVLIYGAAGTMKSTFCFNVLYNEVLQGKKGVYVSIEQSSLSLLKQMVKMGYDISKVNIEVLNEANDVIRGLSRLKDDEPRKLTIVDFGTIRKQLQPKGQKQKFGFSGDMVESILSMIQTLKRKNLCDIVVLDSLTAVYSLTELKEPRSEIFYLFEFLRDLGLTSFVISEESEENTRYSRFGIESYLVDGILHIMLTDRNRKVTREIQIRKMRATDCNNDVFTLEWDARTKKFKALYGGKNPLV